MDLAIRYRPERDLLGKLHQRIGPDYLTRVIIPQTESVLRKQLGNALAEHIYTHEGGLLTRAMLEAMAEIGRNFVEVEDIIIPRIRLPERVRVAIENKVVQEQILLWLRLPPRDRRPGGGLPAHRGDRRSRLPGHRRRNPDRTTAGSTGYSRHQRAGRIAKPEDRYHRRRPRDCRTHLSRQPDCRAAAGRDPSTGFSCRSVRSSGSRGASRAWRLPSENLPGRFQGHARKAWLKPRSWRGFPRSH